MTTIRPLLFTIGLLLPLVTFAADDPQKWIKDTGSGMLTVRTDGVASGTAPRGATHVPVLTIHLEASCDSDVTVDEITLRHVGLGAVSDITALYLTSGYRRYSRVATPNRRGETVLRVLKTTIPSCGTLRLDALMDLSTSAQAGAEHGFTIRSVHDIGSSARRTILHPMDDAMQVRTSPSASGVIRVQFLSLPRKRLRYGTIGTVARIQLSADSAEDHLMRSITLTNEGRARDSDLQWLYLEDRSGNRLTSKVVRMDGRQVTLLFDPPFMLRRSTTQLMHLRAEVRASVRDTVQFILEESADLRAESVRLR